MQATFYIYCPAGKVTGGAELLHQFVDVMNNNNFDARIVYYGKAEHIVPKDYKKYNIKISESVEDSPNNVIVLFEGYFKALEKIKQAKVVLWWLSVDNFYICQSGNLDLIDAFLFNKKFFIRQIAARCKRIIKKFLFKPTNHILSLKKLANDSRIICNAYQSEYAKDFLERNHFKNLHSLKDYINTDFRYEPSLISQKENVVIYNPKKGYAFTKKIIGKGNDIKWCPIQNMTRNQVIDTMKHSKVYIDFGYHPGKDRLPREAAMSGCCIITGKLGSAGFYGDIPIDEIKYKFNQSNGDINLILSKIHDLLDNYEKRINDFSTYRNAINAEKDEFVNDAIHLAHSLVHL